MAAMACAASAATFTVTKVADTADGACDEDCSLREAVIAANASLGEASIVVPPGVYVLDRLGAGEDQSQTGDLDLRVSMSIVGAGASRTVLDGAQADRLIHVPGAEFTPVPVMVTIRDLSVRNGSVAGDGGGIATEGPGQLELERVLVENNHADSGGGVFGFNLVVKDSALIGNRAELGGRERGRRSRGLRSRLSERSHLLSGE